MLRLPSFESLTGSNWQYFIKNPVTKNCRDSPKVKFWSMSKTEEPIKWINRLLGEYYRLQGDNTFYDENGKGKFEKFCVCFVVLIVLYLFHPKFQNGQT